MVDDMKVNFKRRYRNRVLLPGIIIVLITAVLCGGALIGAGRGADSLSLLAQQAEVWRATSNGLDRLSLAQEAVGLCEECIAEADSAKPDTTWLDENIGSRLADLFDVEETYILDGRDRPIYASVRGNQTPPTDYERVAPAVDRFVKLARGEIRRPSGRSNLSERLPGLPPEPFTLPPQPGLSEEPTTIYPTVRTTPGVVHATDLVRIGDRVAFVSAMQMARFDSSRPRSTAPAPMLVSLRYIDGAFLSRISNENYLGDARISSSPEPQPGETSAPLMNSDGVPLTNLFWKPLLGGSLVIKSLLAPAAGLLGVVALLVFLMSLKLRGMMMRDDEQLRELERAHAELQAKEAQAHHLAYHDSLTGLPNRALFNDTVDQALLRTRHGEKMAILLLDLDRFKNVNDRFGHLTGDELIRQVAKRLRRALKGNGVVARLGGDEFAILLEEKPLAEHIDVTLERILDDLRQPYELLGNQAYIGASMGVVMAPDCGTDRTDLMRKADIALYRAKDEGRDSYRYFTESMDRTVQLRTSLEADLRTALASGKGLCVNYQPLVDSKGRKVTGLEALVRWNHPERGAISPQLFIPVAEETGLICEIGDWVLRQACEVAKEWPKLTVAVNLSPVQFCDEGFADRICRIVQEAGVNPRQLELEVTEGVVLDTSEVVRAALRRLRQEGFRIALDDFGTGYSSLSYLREFDVDRIKIDKSFIQGIGQTLDAAAIVTAVVTLGHAMGLQVTAEGVETADQEAFLRSAGCNVLQGFHFSNAVPASELRGSMERFRHSLAA